MSFFARAELRAASPHFVIFFVRCGTGHRAQLCLE